MTFRCERRCVFTVPGPEGPVAVVGEADTDYESEIDYSDYTEHMVWVDRPAEVVVPKNEFSGVIPASTYEKTDLHILRSLAIERGIKGARRLDARALANALNELDHPPS